MNGNVSDRDESQQCCQTLTAAATAAATATATATASVAATEVSSSLLHHADRFSCYSGQG